MDVVKVMLDIRYTVYGVVYVRCWDSVVRSREVGGSGGCMMWCFGRRVGGFGMSGSGECDEGDYGVV